MKYFCSKAEGKTTFTYKKCESYQTLNEVKIVSQTSRPHNKNEVFNSLRITRFQVQLCMEREQSR